MTNLGKPKVFKIVWSIPHYRMGIFRRLSNNQNMNFTVLAGDNPEDFVGDHIATASDVGGEGGINWIKVRSKRLRIPLLRGFGWQPEVISIVKKERPDVIVVTGIGLSLSTIFLLLLCKIWKIPTLNWTIAIRRPEHSMKWFKRKLLMKMVDAFMFYGIWARNWFALHGFSVEKLFVIKNSLDYERQRKIRDTITQDDIKKIRQEFNVTSSDAKLLFHSGRLVKGKNLSLLFEAIKVLKDKKTTIRLVLVGAGEEELPLKKQVKDLCIEQEVLFLGACYDEERIARIITASDLTVVPGPVGLIAMHSLVYGTPILTHYNGNYTHGPEIEAVIDGLTGAFFREGDTSDLVKMIELLLFKDPCKPRMVDACKSIIDSTFNPKYQEKVFIQGINSVLPETKKIPLS